MNEYSETGFLFLLGLLTSEETLELNNAVALLMEGKDEEDLMHREREKTGAIRQIIGVPGYVLFFDCNIAHGSGHNMSPLPRKSFIISYNSIDNKPRPVDNPRPDWVVARQFDIVE